MLPGILNFGTQGGNKIQLLTVGKRKTDILYDYMALSYKD